MHLRNFKGKIVYIDEHKYSNNRDLYILENDYSGLKVIKPNKTFKITFTSVNGEF